MRSTWSPPGVCESDILLVIVYCPLGFSMRKIVACSFYEPLFVSSWFVPYLRKRIGFFCRLRFHYFCTCMSLKDSYVWQSIKHHSKVHV